MLNFQAMSVLSLLADAPMLVCSVVTVYDCLPLCLLKRTRCLATFQVSASSQMYSIPRQNLL